MQRVDLQPECLATRGGARLAPLREMLRRLLIGLAAAGLITAPPLRSSPAVQLAIREGRVWLTADHATVAQILAEWARVGHTQIVNAEQIGAEPLTIELRGVPELEALDVITRSVGGFMTVSRTAGLADEASNLSRFSRLLIVPSSPRVADRAIRPSPAATDYAPPPPIQEPFINESGPRRVIGPDGQPVPDDQEDAPPPPPRAPLALPPGTSMPPGFSEPPDASRGTAVPGVITPPAKPPRRPGGDPTSR